jgi:hypothetical protein
VKGRAEAQAGPREHIRGGVPETWKNNLSGTYLQARKAVWDKDFRRLRLASHDPWESGRSGDGNEVFELLEAGPRKQRDQPLPCTRLTDRREVD